MLSPQPRWIRLRFLTLALLGLLGLAQACSDAEDGAIRRVANTTEGGVDDGAVGMGTTDSGDDPTTSGDGDADEGGTAIGNGAAGMPSMTEVEAGLSDAALRDASIDANTSDPYCDTHDPEALPFALSEGYSPTLWSPSTADMDVTEIDCPEWTEAGVVDGGPQAPFSHCFGFSYNPMSSSSSASISWQPNSSRSCFANVGSIEFWIWTPAGGGVGVTVPHPTVFYAGGYEWGKVTWPVMLDADALSNGLSTPITLTFDSSFGPFEAFIADPAYVE
jgi:hypothetical protein